MQRNRPVPVLAESRRAVRAEGTGAAGSRLVQEHDECEQESASDGTNCHLSLSLMLIIQRQEKLVSGALRRRSSSSTADPASPSTHADAPYNPLGIESTWLATSSSSSSLAGASSAVDVGDDVELSAAHVLLRVRYTPG